MNRIVTAVLVAAMGLGLSVSAVQAATVDLLVTGTVNTVAAPGGVTSPLATNDIVTFHITYDTTAPDTNANPNVGAYKPFTGFTLSFNGQSINFGAANTTFGVTNGGFDAFQITTQSGPGISDAQLQFTDVTGAALGDDSLPTDLLSFQSLPSQRFFLDLWLAGARFPVIVNGSITSIAAVAATPIPAALPLLMTALGGLGFAGWRRRRSEQVSDAMLKAARA